MEDLDQQMLHAIDGFCKPWPADETPYFEALDDLLDAFDRVVNHCGTLDAGIGTTKQLSSYPRQAGHFLVRKVHAL